jgi:hypothetical protein
MQYATPESLVQHACDQAIRSRLRDLADRPVHGDAARLAAKRTSLDLLHLALQEGRLDLIQARLLEQLLATYEQRLCAVPLAPWAGAEAWQLRQLADELAAIDVARNHLRAKHSPA